MSAYDNAPVPPPSGDTFFIQVMGQEQGPYYAQNLAQMAVEGH